MAEALIRGRIEDLVKALNAKDIDGVISLFAPILVSFDIAPLFGALRYFGAENKRRAWQEAFATLRYIYWPLLLRGTRVERHAAGGGVGLRS
jgi:ketosteroid isomerase-like protein